MTGFKDPPGRVILIAGWAHRKNALAGLAGLLSSARGMIMTSCAELLRTAGGEGPRAVSPYARSLAALAAGGNGPCALVGWSMGGVAALEAACRAGLDAERIVLIGATARFCGADDYACGVPLKNLRALRAGVRRTPRETLGAFFRDAAFPENPPEEEIAERVESAVSLGAECLAHGLRYLGETDLREDIRRLAAPALVIHGSRDRIIPAGAGEYLARRIPGARLIIEPNAGHAIAADRPDRVAPVIAGFLGGNA